MLAHLLISLLLSQGAPQRGPPPAMYRTEHVDVGPLVMDVPDGWRRTWRFGTSRFDAPDGSAYLLVDTSTTLTPNIDPRDCRDKIVVNLGGKGRWRGIEIGRFPAAEQIIIENSSGGTSSVLTARYVGCDGNATWSMMFQADLGITRGYFERIVRQVMESVQYGEKPGPSK